MSLFHLFHVMLPEIFCISPSAASNRDDFPLPTCPTITVSWPDTHKEKTIIFDKYKYNTMEQQNTYRFIHRTSPKGTLMSILLRVGHPCVHAKQPFTIWQGVNKKKTQLLMLICAICKKYSRVTKIFNIHTIQLIIFFVLVWSVDFQLVITFVYHYAAVILKHFIPRLFY